MSDRERDERADESDGEFSMPDSAASESTPEPGGPGPSSGTGESDASDGSPERERSSADAGSDSADGASGGNGSGETRGDGGRFGADTPIDYLVWAGVAVLAVTALVALFGFYTGVSRAISVWVTREFRPLVNAAFNLALLLAALGGIGLLLRRRG